MDPLGYMAEPSTDSVKVQSTGTLKISNGTVNLEPGWYQGGINITGGTVNFAPGLYILDSGMDVSGNAVINGDGVTFFNTNTSGGKGGWLDIRIDGTVTAKLSAPTSGYYKGILFWNDRDAPYTNNGSNIQGTSDSVMTGAFYFPSVDLQYAGTSSTSSWQMIISKTMTVTGTSDVTSNFGAHVNELPTRLATLVE
jgi:hypothetical protein